MLFSSNVVDAFFVVAGMEGARYYFGDSGNMSLMGAELLCGAAVLYGYDYFFDSQPGSTQSYSELGMKTGAVFGSIWLLKYFGYFDSMLGIEPDILVNNGGAMVLSVLVGAAGLYARQMINLKSIV